MILKAGDIAPDFSVNDQDGNPVKLSDFKGKKVVLNSILRTTRQVALQNLVISGTIIRHYRRLGMKF